jgi:hypothetical protein
MSRPRDTGRTTLLRVSEQQGQPGGQQPQFMPPQLDEIDVDAGWQPPDDDDQDDRPGLSAVAKVAIVVLALAVVIGGVYALGGFKVRTDVRTIVAPGTKIVSGPYEFTFTEATAQKVKEYDDSIKWEVIVRGTGRTTGDVSISPSTGVSNMFIARDPNTVETADPETATIGRGGFDGPSKFTPGLPAVPYQVEFAFSEFYKPSDKIRFAVFELEYSNQHILDTDEKSWNNTIDAFIYDLPLTVLPEDLDN